MKQFGLSKNERVKLKDDFQKIYSNGKVLYSTQSKVKVIYYLESSVNDCGIKAAFVVSKRAGNAVWRNRVKRLFRVAYRNNKMPLLQTCSSKNLRLILSFSPINLNQKQHKKVKLDDIFNDFVGLLDKVKNKIENA